MSGVKNEERRIKNLRGKNMDWDLDLLWEIYKEFQSAPSYKIKQDFDSLF
jgi:hypothetical protein